MYRWLRQRFPKRVVDSTFAVWYAVLIVLAIYFSDRPAGSFFYLHG